MRRFAVVRPYDDRFRARVFAFIESLGLAVPDPSWVVAPGTPDEEAVARLERLEPRPDLLLIPFHQHKLPDGTAVDGFGVLEKLPEALVAERIPILMPVSDFGFAASYPRRRAEAAAVRPRAVELVVEMPHALIGDPTVVHRLARIAPWISRA